MLEMINKGFCMIDRAKDTEGMEEYRNNSLIFAFLY